MSADRCCCCSFLKRKEKKRQALYSGLYVSYLIYSLQLSPKVRLIHHRLRGAEVKSQHPGSPRWHTSGVVHHLDHQDLSSCLSPVPRLHYTHLYSAEKTKETQSPRVSPLVSGFQPRCSAAPSIVGGAAVGASKGDRLQRCCWHLTQSGGFLLCQRGQPSSRQFGLDARGGSLSSQQPSGLETQPALGLPLGQVKEKENGLLAAFPLTTRLVVQQLKPVCCGVFQSIGNTD